MKLTAFAIVPICLLVACGGGGSGSDPAPTTPSPPLTPPSLLRPESAWTAPLPAQATMISAEAFEAGLRDGSLTLVTPEQMADQQGAARLRREGTLRDDLGYLRGLADRGRKTDALLAKAAASADPFAEPVGDVGGAPVRLLSAAAAVGNVAEAQRKARDPAALRLAYSAQFALLTAEQRAALPTPESLASASAESLRAALQQLDTELAAVVFPNGVITITEAGGAKSTPVAGNGMDQSACSTSGNGLQFALNWPLKRYVSPVKNQGARGTCWAFAAIGAIESRERVLAGSTPNLSEQFLVGRVKRVWDAEDYEDGYQSESALDDLLENRQPLPPESYWTYNPSPGRPGAEGRDGYAGSCNGYNGSCSATAHQAAQACTSTFNPSRTFCSGYAIPTFTGSGIGASPVMEIWDGDEDEADFPLHRMMNLLRSGVTLMASFPVYVGFDVPQNGFVTDFREGFTDRAGVFHSGDARGHHAALIVGYIPAADVQTAIRSGAVVLPGVDPAIGGYGLPAPLVPGGFPAGVRGYFILRNSWGCGGGDGGYYYLPDSYVRQHFHRISALQFDTQRVRLYEQAANLQIATNRLAELGVAIDLFSATPPPGGSLADLTVTASSSVATDRITQRATLFGTAVHGATFGTAGPRVVRVTIQYRGQEPSSQEFLVSVRETPPDVRLLNPPATVRIGETVPLSAFIIDPTDRPAPTLCSSVEWRTEGSDVVLDAARGSCQQRVRFDRTGSRLVNVSVVSAGGRRAARDFAFEVSAAPETYPRIPAGELSRLPQAGRNGSCSRVTAVADGSEIDLRSNVTGCDGRSIAPFRASATVENPDNESLGYRWSLVFATREGTATVAQGTSPTFDIGFQTFGGGGTYQCGVNVTVTPPAPERQKTRTVWGGTCVVNAVSPR